jgi:hypothetical protein
MPKKKPLTAGAKARIEEEIDKTFDHAWFAKGVLSRHFKQTDKVCSEWEELIRLVTRLRKEIPAEIKRVSN